METTRRRNADEARNAILAAARLRFGADGYEPTTIRTIAGDASSDPALVMQYFGSKEGLFRATAEMNIELPDLSGVPVADVAGLLVPAFLQAWRPGGAFLGVLRAASTSPVAVEALAQVFREQVAPGLASVARDHPAERAGLVAAALLGIAVARHILRTPPLARMSEDRLVHWLGPVIAHYLDDPLP